eukprot:1156920-Pelagomonas_calceolata.AAC.5
MSPTNVSITSQITSSVVVPVVCLELLVRAQDGMARQGINGKGVAGTLYLGWPGGMGRDDNGST